MTSETDTSPEIALDLMFFTARTFYQKLSGYGDTTLELLDGGGVQQAGSVDINIERDGATVGEVAREPGTEVVIRKAHLCEATAAMNPVAVKNFPNINTFVFIAKLICCKTI